MEALATRGHLTAASALSLALVLLAMTPLGDGEWVAWLLVIVTTLAASLHFVHLLTRLPHPRTLLPVLTPGVLLLVAAISDHVSGPEDERLAAAVTIVTGIPLATVGLATWLARRRGRRLQRPGPDFQRHLEAAHYYCLLLAVGLGAAVWTHSDRGLGDALRTVIGGA